MVGRGITPLGRHRQREQFARAVDALPANDPDPRFADELAVVALLREAARTSGPDDATRARMRERVLGARAAPVGEPDSRRGGARGRLVVALAAALCLVFSLAGMSLLLSRDALPGDALYGVKRTAEDASLGLTFGEESKGFKRLEFAAARLTELETLAHRHRGSDGGPVSGYLTALADHDADAAAGSRALTAFGVNSDQRALTSLADWAGAQRARLTDLRDDLPAQAAERAGGSLELLDRIERRATDLRARSGCTAITSGQSDDIGPLPATGECTSPQPGPTGSVTELTTTAPTTQQPPPATTAAPQPTPNPAPVPTQPQPTQPQPAPTGTAPGLPTLPLPLPPITSLLPQPSTQQPQLPLPLPLPGLPGLRLGG
ncbi:DUF5667 domain-containing protein [Saccharothrix coeruleofusca]|uniref:DUF5667 domain-containing protein n=1 Tax=Saccharothrix coeruleofusca TaxID=33919 RepID=A0A918ALP4_9PSEU|nr:DUF5667 domain-containing protein [Saccharothrix coeruleofusca]GGP57052.1 hypothetical protein GCM10010185_31680 [Saccharothrix coeruleofusca]